MIIRTFTHNRQAGFAMPSCGRVRGAWLRALPTATRVATDQGTRVSVDGIVEGHVAATADQFAFSGTPAWSPPPE